MFDFIKNLFDNKKQEDDSEDILVESNIKTNDNVITIIEGDKRYQDYMPNDKFFTLSDNKYHKIIFKSSKNETFADSDSFYYDGICELSVYENIKLFKIKTNLKLTLIKGTISLEIKNISSMNVIYNLGFNYILNKVAPTNSTVGFKKDNQYIILYLLRKNNDTFITQINWYISDL